MLPSNCSSAGTATGGGLGKASPCPPNTVRAVLVLGGRALDGRKGGGEGVIILRSGCVRGRLGGWVEG